MQDDGNEFTVGEFSEYKRGRHARNNSASDQNTFEHAGEIGDTQLRESFTHARAAYRRLIERGGLPEDLPSRFYETELSRSTRGIEGTETASRALSKGDTGTLRNFVGAPDKATDLSGREPIQRLQSLIHDNPSPFFYVGGSPGSGKSRLALLMSEVWTEQNPEGVIASNIRSLEPHPPDRLEDGQRVSHVGGIGDLREWLEQDQLGETPDSRENFTPKCFILDEASSSIRGGGAQGHKVRKLLAPMFMKIREHMGNSGLIIIIGHSGSDVAPSIRSIAKYIDKTSKKTATVYESVKNRSGSGEIVSFDGIPPGNYSMSEYEKPSFDLEPDSGGESDGVSVTESERKSDLDVLSAVSTKELTGMSNKKIADEQLSTDVSGEWVRRRIKSYEKGELDERLSEWGVEVREKFGI